MPAPLLFDAHLDLAINALEWNRDLTQPIDILRERERHLSDKPDRAHNTVSLPEMRKAGIGICVATQLARIELDAYSPVQGWRSPAQAWAMTQGQLAWYRAMEELGEMVQIRDLPGLRSHLKAWAADPEHTPIGYILSLEGADSLVTLDHLQRSHADGLRAIGPAHYGPGVYANGTDATGGFNQRGKDLLREINRLGIILDVTHLCDDCFWEALDLFDGPLWASHQNCRALVPHNRQFSDEQILAVIERGGVFGAPMDAWMIVPDWQRGKTTPQSAGVTLQQSADHIDHICQLAGNANHVGIGSDLDGCFGTEQTPQDIQTIADLQKLPAILKERGCSETDLTNFRSRNFLRFLESAWG